MRNGEMTYDLINYSHPYFCCCLESLDFSSLTSKILWSQLTTEAKLRYNFDLNW
jgi:hypothetical protein